MDVLKTVDHVLYGRRIRMMDPFKIYNTYIKRKDVTISRRQSMPSSNTGERMYIARQPIFNERLDVFGYELLFRGDKGSGGYDAKSSAYATATVIGGLFESGIEEIVGGHRAFINFDAAFLSMDIPEIIEPDRLIIEVLEDVVVDDALIERLLTLKEKGYKIALDDFIEDYQLYPLVPLADIIKFDLMATPLESIETTVGEAIRQGKILLAEKIETEGEFLRAKQMGFKLFQGYFFSKPHIVGQSSAKKMVKSNYLQILTELKKEEPSYQVLAEIVEKDAQMAYRLMRIIHSRAGDDLVYSIKKALTYIGLKELERWINVLMIQDLGGEKPRELMKLSLMRTKFSELIAAHSVFKNRKYEASMLGLFSTIDAMLDVSMEEAMSKVALPKTISDALVSFSGKLSPVYKLLLAYEQADFNEADELSKALDMKSEALFEYYKGSVKWADEMMLLMGVST